MLTQKKLQPLKSPSLTIILRDITSASWHDLHVLCVVAGVWALVRLDHACSRMRNALKG